MSGDALAQLPMEVFRNQGDVAPRAVGTAGWVGVALGDPRAFFPTQMIRWFHHDRFLPLADRIQAAFCQLQKQIRLSPREGVQLAAAWESAHTPGRVCEAAPTSVCI